MGEIILLMTMSHSFFLGILVVGFVGKDKQSLQSLKKVHGKCGKKEMSTNMTFFALWVISLHIQRGDLEKN